MLPYWILFFIPAIGILSPVRLQSSPRKLFFWLAWFSITLLVGLRHEVGADWYNYFVYLDAGRSASFLEIIQRDDPSYYLLNWVSARVGGGIYFVNTACAAIMASGVVRFSKRQAMPWLALLVAVPYLVIVVGMGYTRQATAIGLVLLGLVSLSDAKVRSFLVWVLIGASFHKSAVVVLPLAMLASGQNRMRNMVCIGIICLLFGYFFLFDSVSYLWRNYVVGDYQSEGAFVRVTMNALPGLLYLTFHRRFFLGLEERRLWWWMSVLSIACIPLVLVFSTVIDRVALYLIPLQVFLFSRLHLITRDKNLRAVLVLGVIAYYSAVLSVWLLFASNSFAWLPYKSAFLIS